MNLPLNQQWHEDLKSDLKDVMKKALNQALKLSSGTLTTKDLKDRDHPYATRHQYPLAPLLPINIQSGKFYANWDVTPIKDDLIIKDELINISPEADFLDSGTKNMFARPISSTLENYIEKEMTKKINEGERFNNRNIRIE